MEGGTITWTLSTGMLAWTAPLRVFSPVSGFQCIVAAGSVQLDQSGKLLHAPLVRYPTGSSKTIIAATASQVPDVSPNDQLLFAVRYGDKVYWRNGLVMQDGDSVVDFRPEFGGGDLVGYTIASSTALGMDTRPVDAPGDYVTVLGHGAGAGATGSNGTYIGYRAGYTACSGPSNTYIGYTSGYGVSGSGEYNTYVGARAGYSSGACSFNVIVGYDSQIDASDDTYAIVIGYQTTGKGPSTTVIGRIGTGETTDTWMRGNELRVGNEDDTTKYFKFQNSSEVESQPGFKWDSVDLLQWSSDGLTYYPFSEAAAVVYFELDLSKGLETDNAGVAKAIGATYVDASDWPVDRIVLFRCVLE
jgi:hypothetical protein